MVEYLVLRLKTVKGFNVSPATRQSITNVVELQRCGSPSFIETCKLRGARFSCITV